MPPRVTVVVLAGGASTRLPGKLGLPIGGEPMLARVHRRLTAGGRPSVISARAPLTPDIASTLATRVVYDEHPGAGPLAGLAVAAAAVTTPLLFAAAGDLPNIDATFVDRLEAEYDRLAAGGHAPDALVPTWSDGRPEPLAALYRADRLAVAASSALHAGKRKVMSALDALEVARFPLAAEDEAVLANVNTPSDYKTQQG